VGKNREFMVFEGAVHGSSVDYYALAVVRIHRAALPNRA